MPKLFLIIVLAICSSMSIQPLSPEPYHPLNEEARLARLIAALQDDDVGRLAARRLAESGHPRARNALLAAIKDQSSFARYSAAIGLGYIHDPEGIRALASALRDEISIRGAAADSLRRLGDPAAVAPLLQLMKDPSAEIRVAAIHGITKIRDPRAAEAVYSALRDGDLGVRKAAMQAVAARNDSGALDTLVSALDDKAGLANIAAVLLVNRADGKGIDPFLAALSHPDEKVWYAVWQALWSSWDSQNTQKIVNAMCDKLEHGTGESRSRAAAGLWTISDPDCDNTRVVDILLRSMNDPDREVRLSSFRALCRRTGEQAFNAILAYALDESSEFHGEALGELFERKDPRSFDAMMRCFKSNPLLRTRVVDLLGSMGDARAIDALTAAAMIPSPVSVRRSAVAALGSIHHPRAVTALIKVLKLEKDPAVREVAAGKLAESKVSETVAMLEGAIHEDPGNTDLRTIAASIKTERAQISSIPVSTVRILQSDDAAQIVKDLKAALGRLGISLWTPAGKIPDRSQSSRAVWAFLPALQESRDGEYVAVALGLLSDRRAVRPLMDILAIPRTVGPCLFTQIAAIDALGNLGDRRAVPALIDALARPSPRVAGAAAIALGKLHDTRSIGPLMQALEYEHPVVQWAAAEALGEIGDSQTIEPLTACLPVSQSCTNRRRVTSKTRLAAEDRA